MADDFQALVQRVKEANDIVEVVGGYVALRPAGQTYKGLCPFHDDSRPSLDVDPRRQRYRCWSCGKVGDVISFVSEYERVDFRGALEALAERAGISLEKIAGFRRQPGRAIMLEVVSWAASLFHRCLLDASEAEAARAYLGRRRLTGASLRAFGIGYAPGRGDWLVQRAAIDGISSDMLERVGLIAPSRHGSGYYDRFRDRVIFPIRDPQGRPVGFGGRVLPGSPAAERGPKYYNSCETELFNKRELLFGLDLARAEAARLGFVVIVEGYTDVVMAHQMGISNVVATMGTAITDQHVRVLRRFVPKAVLVFDADAGGSTGVDRALEVFAGSDLAIQIATLPQGLDPCDLLVEQGAEAFRNVVAGATDVLDFKLHHAYAAAENLGIEGQRRVVDEVLRLIAKGPERADAASQMKRELMVTRIARRFGLQEEVVRGRMRMLRRESRSAAGVPEPPKQVRSAPAKAHERVLLELLLADPDLVAQAKEHIDSSQVEHPGLRTLLEGLYRLLVEGNVPSLDSLRTRIENEALISKAFEMQERGLANPDRPGSLRDVIECFRRPLEQLRRQEVRQQLQNAKSLDEAERLLQQLQKQTRD